MDLDAYMKKIELELLVIGEENWWAKIASIGTPLKIDLKNGKTDLIFLWRKQETQPKHSAVYLDINGVINHHNFTPAQLLRYKNTDVYYYICQADSTWNGTYALIPVPDNVIQPTYHGDLQQQINQHRQWIMKRRAYHSADPLNKINLPHTRWGEMHSRIYLDPSIIHSSWASYDQNSIDSVGLSPCQSHTYESTRLQQNRRFWTYSTAQNTDYDIPIVILLDGEFWVESIPVMSALDHCTENKQLPPAVYIMIDAISFQQRANDLPCNTTFWQAVIEEILPIVAEQYPISADRKKTIIAGQSFGGLSALYAVLNWPERFGNAIVQSGSFWWPEDTLIHQSHRNKAAPSQPNSLYIERYISSQHDNSQINIFMEVGKREGMMVPLSHHIHRNLTKANYQVRLQEYDGGHDRLIWREGLIKGLIWLTNKF